MGKISKKLFLRMNRNNQKVYLSLMIGVLSLLFAIFFAIKFNQPSNHQAIKHQTNNSLTKPVKDKSDFQDLSIRQIVSLATVYAQKKFPDDPAWQSVYQAAVNGDLSIQRYEQYHFANDYQVSADNNQSLYILNKRAALVITKAQEARNSNLLFGNANGQVGTVNLKAAYDLLKTDGRLGDWKALSQKITVDNQIHQQTPNSTKHANSQIPVDTLEKFNIPSIFWGKWYIVNKYGHLEEMNINLNQVDGQTLYKQNDKLMKSKAFNNSSLRKKIYFAEYDNNVLAYGPVGIDLNLLKYGQGILIAGASNGPLNRKDAFCYYRSPKEAQAHPNKILEN